MPNESRSTAIAHHVRLALRHSGLSMRDYAIDVAAHYATTVPLHARDVEFHSGGDVHADIRANSQILTRMLDGTTVRLPVSIEDSLVLSLPEAFRGPAMTDLCARWGLLAVPVPRTDNARAGVTLGDLMRETGELLSSLAEPLADGRIDVNDAPHCRRALKELRDLQAAMAGLEVQLVSCMAQAQTPTTHNVATLSRKAG